MNDGLRIRDLTVTIGGLRLVEGVDLDVPPEGTLVLLGESGSGKSLTVRAALGLLGRRAAVSGEATLGGAPAALVRGRAAGLVPQDHTAALDPLRRVGRQIREVLRHHGVAGDPLALLERAGVPDAARVARAYPHELSGGLRQRALIAIATACDPEVVIADEATSALDPETAEQVLGLLTRRSLLLVTHDVGVARRLGGEVAVMYAGRVVERGRAATVLGGPRHPYTRGLLAAEPRPGIARGTLPVIPGRPPEPAERPAGGCAFAPRCPLVHDACRSVRPELTGESHRAACHV
ncbi:ABC transporter ATP-binding protein [Microbispora sp. NBRC 16548]|uniref:ABC transporter ATP-binding protein n=1 Tax=Microbispora sp. NBRC 16548 TaxID=3030994 RepID=UPI0024A17C2D|nr:ABC transporter ATP-binding protein [Microbispora sp. NBRC 16548]GLX10988.1 ABC transporter ATP-binding protein [Microbispora sp. NBRC 16548]